MNGDASTLVALASVDDIEPGTLRACAAAEVAICLARTADGSFFALEDKCSHEDTELSEGELVGNLVECPLHGSRFDVATGDPKELPAWLPVKTFPVVIQGSTVFARMDET